MSKTVSQTATIAHGFTMSEIDRYARSVARYVAPIGRWNYSFEDCLEDAWFGIVECLYTSVEPPTRIELLRAGRTAIARQTDERIQAHGLSGELTKEGLAATRKSFDIYWRTVTTSSEDDFTDRVAERLALPQLLSLLTADEYDVIIARATHDTKAAAAEDLGISMATFTRRLRSARQTINEAWLAPETPRQKPAYGGDTCTSGHPRAEHGRQYVRASTGQTVWECMKCRRDSALRGHHRRYKSKVVEQSLGDDAA